LIEPRSILFFCFIVWHNKPLFMLTRHAWASHGFFLSFLLAFPAFGYKGLSVFPSAPSWAPKSLSWNGFC
jgi:hypothetical protein